MILYLVFSTGYLYGSIFEDFWETDAYNFLQAFVCHWSRLPATERTKMLC